MKNLNVLTILVSFIVAPFAAHAVDVERVISPGGIEAWLVQDHANPLLSMNFAFAGGAELNSKDKNGLDNLAASTMDEGAGTLDSKAFQQRLTDQSISLRFSAGLDSFGGHLKTLTKNRNEAFDLLRLALTQPRFDVEPVARLKSQIKAGLRSNQEDPGTLAYQTLFKTFYPGHGYGNRSKGTLKGLVSINHDDLVGFVKTRLAKDGLKIGVVGDVTPMQLGYLLDQTFGGLPETSNFKPVPDIKTEAKGRVTIIKKDVVQSTIVFAVQGPKRDDPDFYSAVVMNHILGGGSFTSRLYTEIREKRGLAYSVGTSLYPLKHTGLIVGNAGTENARVGETVNIVRREWKRLANGDLQQQELKDAKNYVTGSFPLRLTSTSAIAQVLVAMQVHNLGIDYLDQRNAYIQAVTLESVRHVAAKYLKPDTMDVVIVGKPNGIQAKP